MTRRIILIAEIDKTAISWSNMVVLSGCVVGVTLHRFDYAYESKGTSGLWFTLKDAVYESV